MYSFCCQWYCTEDTVKSVLLNEATPLLDDVASSAAIVILLPETEVLTPSPARNSMLPPKTTDPWVELSSVNVIEELLNDEFPTLDNVLLEASIVLLVKVCGCI